MNLPNRQLAAALAIGVSCWVTHHHATAQALNAPVAQVAEVQTGRTVLPAASAAAGPGTRAPAVGAAVSHGDSMIGNASGRDAPAGSNGQSAGDRSLSMMSTSQPDGWTTLLCGIVIAGFMAWRKTRLPAA